MKRFAGILNKIILRWSRYSIPYRAQLDGARPCEAFDIRDARMGKKLALTSS